MSICLSCSAPLLFAPVAAILVVLVSFFSCQAIFSIFDQEQS